MSMSRAAQRNDITETLAGVEAVGSEGGLKQVAAERLAAHRNRRAAERAQAQAVVREPGRAAARANKVREAVAARYEQSVSYREFLAAEAERALQLAQAEAEVAARKAVAVAEAKMQIMEELEQWTRSEADMDAAARESARQMEKTEARGELAHALADIALGAQELVREEAAMQRVAAGLTVKLYEDVLPVGPIELKAGPRTGESQDVDEELRELEEEIAFRMAPELEPYVLEAQPIPGNLIEFPRQLVAPRKARPRLAEGPLREDAPAEPQLRIFEVEAEQISVEPVAEAGAAPEWQSMLLDAGAAPVRQAPAGAQLEFTLQPQTAPLELRVMAAAVDLAWIGLAFVGFAAVAVELIGASLRMMPKPQVGASAAGVLVVLYVAYQMLFFSLSGATPGMSYARIGLCTFGDRNPSRKAMRRRVLAVLLAACPLGLGLAWAWLDEESLGWHDRMSRMYQRAY